VQPIRRPRNFPPPPENEPIPAIGMVQLAIIEALRTEPASWERTGGPDVLGALQGMLKRWDGDEDVCAEVRRAIVLVCSRQTGRWPA
jgi:hypothetical protein